MGYKENEIYIYIYMFFVDIRDSLVESWSKLVQVKIYITGRMKML